MSHWSILTWLCYSMLRGPLPKRRHVWVQYWRIHLLMCHKHPGHQLWYVLCLQVKMVLQSMQHTTVVTIMCFFFTENVVIPSGACVTDCSGIADGLYHSCLSCSVFVECEAGVLTDGIDCSLGQQFDDREARCVDDSSTCIGDYEICVCSIKKQQQIRRY